MEQAELLWSNSHERPLYGGEFYRTLLQRTISVISLIFETVQNLPKKWGAGGGCPHCDFRLQKGHNAIFFLALALTLTLLRCRRVIFTSMIYSQLHPHLHTHTHTHTFAGKPRVLPCYISFAIYLHIANTPDFQEILKTVSFQYILEQCHRFSLSFTEIATRT